MYIVYVHTYMYVCSYIKLFHLDMLNCYSTGEGGKTRIFIDLSLETYNFCVLRP